MKNLNEIKEINLEQAEIIKDDELKMLSGGGNTYMPNPDYFDVDPNDPKYNGCWFH